MSRHESVQGGSSSPVRQSAANEVTDNPRGGDTIACIVASRISYRVHPDLGAAERLAGASRSMAGWRSAGIRSSNDFGDICSVRCAD